MTTRRLALFAALSWLGCGAASGTRPVTDDDIRAVQLAEARQDEAFPRATSDDLAPGARCEDACGAASGVCEDARAICAVARETEDLDLRTRCDDANRKCARARSAVDACACVTNDG